jgi:broad specificity phosphatase PhoE
VPTLQNALVREGGEGGGRNEARKLERSDSSIPPITITNDASRARAPRRSFTHFDLVVCSPLTRTLETARHIFKRGRQPGQPPFMDAKCYRTDSNTGQEFHLPAPRVLVREECRERWGEYVCDGRRSISEIYAEFPDFDFSEVSDGRLERSNI